MNHHDNRRRLTAVLVINLVLVAIQIAAGIVAHSLGLLSDAGHNLVDVLAVGLSLWAVRLTMQAPNASRSFGYHRSTVLAAQANAALILAASGVIAFEAVRRLMHPSAVHGEWVIGVGLLALIGNGISAMLLHKGGHSHAQNADAASEDLNMRSALLHMAGDALAAAGVVVAGVVIVATGAWYRLDPAVSLLIAVLIGVAGLRLLRDTAEVLLEATPPGMDLVRLTQTMAAVPGVEEVHDVHAWSLSSDVRALSAHLVMAEHPSLEEAQAVATLVRAAIAAPFGIAHATFELECEACNPDGNDPCAMDGLTIGHQSR